MRDIFISTLPERIGGWAGAFPDSILIKDIQDVPANAESSGSQHGMQVFWLHMHDDRQQWMTDTIAAIMKKYQAAKIVILANMPNHAESLRALSLGATGYAHAYSSPEMLKEIKAVISHGGIWLGQALLQRLIETSAKLAGNPPEYVDDLLSRLTKR